MTDADHQFLGYDVKDWAWSLRGRILLRLGEVAPARDCFDKVLGQEGSIDPTVTIIGHFGYVELARHLGDSMLAGEHASQTDVLAQRHGSAYLKFYAAVFQALADAAANRLDAAMGGIRFCMDLQERTRAAMEFKPELFAYLAEFQKEAGLLDQALATAAEAMSLSRAGSARLPLCRATIIHAEASFLTRREAAREDATEMLRAAQRLLEATGAELYRPLLVRAQTLLDGS